MMKKLSRLFFVGLAPLIHALITVLIVSCVSGMVLLKLMQGEDINRYLCLGISIGVALIAYLHIRYGCVALEKILGREQKEFEKENEK